MMVKCIDGKNNDFGFEMRRLLLRRLKDYYQPLSRKIIPNNETDENLLNMLCNVEDAAFDYGFLPVFGDNEISQVFYNYKTSESFTAIKTEEGYSYFEGTYSLTNSFSSLIALNLGLCYNIFVCEQFKVDDPELREDLAREVAKIENTLDEHKKLVK